MTQDRPRILLIDSYDSFTCNLASLCRRSIPNCNIHIIRNDEVTLTKLTPILDYFSAVIVGPGPGSPQNIQDIGVVKHLWKLADEHLLPIFGVCLGLQSLAIEFGATIKRLKVVKHGQISRIEHKGSEIFRGVGEVEAVRYHSLHVILDGSEDIKPLAWADDGEENGRVIMGIKHVSKPFWGVQYHPESVRTHGGGEDVLRNFWRLAHEWTTGHNRNVRSWTSDVEDVVGKPWPNVRFSPSQDPSHASPTAVNTRILDLPGISVTSICQIVGVLDEDSDFVLLDSAAHPGRFSIIGCLTSSSPKITYYVGDHRVCVQRESNQCWEDLGSQDIWAWLAAFMRPRKAHGGEQEVPFWGGLVGYLSYEVGVHSLSASVSAHVRDGESPRHSDVNLVFVERSIVVDSVTGKVYVQSLLPEDNDWLSNTSSLLQLQTVSGSRECDLDTQLPSKKRKTASAGAATISLPDKSRYISRIKQAKEYLFSGDSYELCLTAATRILVPKPLEGAEGLSSWELYQTLRKRNPAPHSAYIRLHPSTLVSSSPERFLSFSRPPATVCQLRPIKGTVRKAPGITRAIAEEALVGSAKEVAENLMIVDLIRHDLHSVVGEDVEVKQFCAVEEYETVWQLVSVIEGKASPDLEHQDLDIGWEVLKRSLPPGSMTGAPKKRSVEILHTLEDQDRSIYSGVFGYWCVGGGGDWSVTIRSCFKYDASKGALGSLSSDGCGCVPEKAATESWILGAGGAITALSDPEAEWEEMVIKVESVLRAFNGAD